MLTYAGSADVCYRMLTYADVGTTGRHTQDSRWQGSGNFGSLCERATVWPARHDSGPGDDTCGAEYCQLLLRYADVCWRMLTYADVCWRMLTSGDDTCRAEYCQLLLWYADMCWRMLTYADVCWRMLTYAESMLTYAERVPRSTPSVSLPLSLSLSHTQELTWFGVGSLVGGVFFKKYLAYRQLWTRTWSFSPLMFFFHLHYLRQHTSAKVVWGNICSSMRTHVVVWGHIYVWGHICSMRANM
jgi:hypothetical protein